MQIKVPPEIEPRSSFDRSFAVKAPKGLPTAVPEPIHFSKYGTAIPYESCFDFKRNVWFYKGRIRFRRYQQSFDFDSPKEIALNSFWDFGQKVTVPLEINHDFFKLLDYYARGGGFNGNYIKSHSEVVREALLAMAELMGYTGTIQEQRFDGIVDSDEPVGTYSQLLKAERTEEANRREDDEREIELEKMKRAREEFQRSIDSERGNI